MNKPASALLLLVVAGASLPLRAAFDTTFDSGPQLGARLIHDVVRIETGQEHGFGLIVGASSRHLFVITARHVVAPASSGERVEVILCTAVQGDARRAAELLPIEVGQRDLALLRTVRPADYEPTRRALATPADVRVAQDAWLLGEDGRCGVAPRSGSVAALPDGQQNLRIEFPGVRGGASGGPVITGYGVIGIVTNAEDLTYTALGIAAVESVLAAHRQLAVPWQLTAARNIPPDDPRSAEVDLSETLGQYLFGVRNLQRLLSQDSVPRRRFVAFADEYNAAVNRFRDARTRHDGTLDRHWPPSVLQQWLELREQLWQVHQNFWRMNEDSQAIFDSQRVPASVQQRMHGLDAELSQLEAGIDRFLRGLAQRSTP
jgi:hypothetical protein